MSKNYRNIPPVGQWDGMSCWAACLEWWLKAVGDGRPKWSQKDLIVNFYGFTDDSGGIQVDKLIVALNNNPNLKIQSGMFQSAKYRYAPLPLGETPVIIMFREPQGGIHMNVVFGQTQRDVICMEPYFPFPGVDYKRTGSFMQRKVDHFLGAKDFGLAWARCD
ncbi:hypothetical protein OPKNFCMD_3975 [Methylobacterium crusticola]|uniref:Peptidase C39-like domain-containing protein n=1 Tax=Methylobacterium crusticola TaxID=1697972 RepID=A0ABQ4R0U0_9HYPH|nr:hypothetical protein [Methylobacterium crusticola]GJD51223.1 hypothetical protein OPKNFCMD_3975 [Methylobacterium crusticola]